MANIRTFFTCIPYFFSLLWASFINLFVSNWRTDTKTCDIEAGMPSSLVLEKEPTTVCNVEQDVETGNTLRTSSTDEFVDIDLNGKTQPLKISEKKTQAMNFEHPTKAIKFDMPSRRPSGRMSAVDPVKSRILDTTLKNVQDRAINVIKPVVITHGSFTAVACTAQVEYYHAVINESSSAQIEYSHDNISFNTKSERFHVPPTKITDIDLPTSESFKPFTLNVEDVDAPVIESTASRTAYTETYMGKHLDAEYDYPPRDIPFTPLPERKSWRVKEKRSRQRESLFDLIAQFPDIPRHTPPGPEVSVISLEDLEDDSKYSHSVDNAPQSPTVSERSASSSGCDNIIAYYGSAADDTAQTSAPGSPDLSSSVLGEKSFRPDMSNIWHVGTLINSHQADAFRKLEADSLAKKPLEDPVPMSAKDAHCEGAVADSRGSVRGEFCTPCFSESSSKSYVNASACDQVKPVDAYHSQTGFDDAEQPEDQIDIEAHRATACAILSAPQEDDSDVSMDGLLGQLEASSFDSTYKRPQSLVWFAERNFRAVAPMEVTPVSESAEYVQPTVTPLRIVKKNKVRPVEAVVQVAVAESLPEVVAESAAEVVLDEILVQECLRWEESRQAGLKAFREAVVGDDDFYNLFYQDSCRYSQSPLVTDGQGLSGDFATNSATDSNSGLALNECLLVNEGLESLEDSLEGMSSTLDLSNSSEITMLEEHVAASPSADFALKDPGRVNAKQYGSSDNAVEPCERLSVRFDSSDIDEQRFNNESEDIQWSALELYA